MSFMNMTALTISRADESMTLYFEAMENLLRAKAYLAEALPDLKVEVTAEPNTLVVKRPEAALELVKLWFGITPSGQLREQPSTKADRIISMLQAASGASAEDVAKALGIKKTSAVARISVETRKRGLTTTLVDGKYHL